MAEQKKQPAATTPLVNNPRTGAAGVGQYLIDSYGNNILNKYKINEAIYPADLFSNRGEYGDSYVIFYINVPESSRLFAEKRVVPTDRDTTETGAAIAKLSGELRTSAQEASKSLGIGGESGLGLGLRQNKRITDVITLYTPNNLTARYSVSWDAEDMVLASAAADIVNTLAGGSSSQSAGVIDRIKGAAKTGGAAAVNIGLGKLPGGSAVSAMSGLAANPKKEQLFKNVDFRTFNFEYQFAPRNENESKQVKKIIDLFKLHMHPEFKDDAGFLFLYPSEFEIVYYLGDSENMNLPRHTTSVLIDMSVNYTPQGMYNTFDDGASTLITINLTFKELAILTKAEILDGF